ncbi:MULTISPECIES: c-type cytochrome [unclassified Roseivivax]|uniref:c-type cytochrome n=1 Tax=Roseivivax sp. GX 12232 TaxID=2900547 RepID=UPI001E333AEA|nr:cytochrome c [Roseivivax sp. GX 12232]MCE0504840.1 cytochrome c [Roseivivax sp. GX 12232]
MKTFVLAAAIAGLAMPAVAQDFDAQLKARQGQFRILAINLGILGDMAKGEVDYSAEAAQDAADSIQAISMVNQPPLWPEGSGADSRDGTRAKAEIWGDFDDFTSKWAALGEQATALQASAGDGREAVGAGLRELGGACKACHDSYRASPN